MEPEVYRQMADIQHRHWWFVARRWILARLILTIELPDNCEILEAGCGPGGNLAMLSSFGEVYGFDPDQNSRDFAKTIGYRNITEGRLPLPIPYMDKQFDLVCAFDVIEHLDDDLSSLIALREKLKPGGHAIFTVPGHQFLWSSHDARHHHKRRYEKEEFENLIIEAGFEMRKSSWFNCFLFPLILMIRLINRMMGNRHRDDETMPWKPINAILTMIFKFEGVLLKHFNLPFGVSIVVLAVKGQHASRAKNGLQ